ncbi:MAG: dipeptidase [Acetobacteraceae bacterium]|nr:dipeptidase [Acetobacteraceae bacterium]MBV9116625.1 dipeptidase [Acetobacteraceae bacterium]
MTSPLDVHRGLLAIDTHIDIPWPEGPDPFEETRRRVDLPKMLRGGIAAGCFAAYVPQAPRTAENDQAAYARVMAMLETIRGMARSERGLTTVLATTADEVEAAWRDGVVSIMPAVENGFAMGDDLSRLARFRALGARYMTLTHNGHNALADSAQARADFGDAESEHGGLSELGRAAVAELNRLGMLVDVAHVSRAAMMQAAACSRTPIVSTHSCIRALCDHPRNLDDAQLDTLRDVGGVVQVTAVSAFIKAGAKPDQVGVTDFVDHIDYAVRRIGVEHVGISSDFDGGGGFTGWHDAGESPNLTAELLRRGYGRRELALLWGGNFLRVLRRAEALAS